MRTPLCKLTFLALPFSLAGLSCRSQPEAGPAPAAAAPGAVAAAEPQRTTADARARAVEEGLAWLARHQQPDGSWRARAVDPACNTAFVRDAKHVWTDHYDVGSTALGLLAFVRAGWTTSSQGESATVVARALDWLRAQQNESGFYSKERSFLYNDALATLALVEHYAATKEAREREPAQRGVDFLVRAQRPSPTGTGAWGWRYASRMEIEQKYPAGAVDDIGRRELFDSDVSVSGWAAAALVNAERAGLSVDPAALAGAAAFVRWCRAGDGLVGYNDPRNAGLTVQGRDDHYDYHPAGMSSIALRMALEIGPRRDDPFLESAARRLVSDPPGVSANRLSIDYYYWLNGTLALASYDAGTGAKYLPPWNHSLLPALLGLQETRPDTCGSGGWLVPDRWSYAAGPVYTTAMALLALEQKD